METFDPTRFQQAFFERSPQLREPLEAMAALPNICVYVKDLQSRYILSNERHRVNYGHIPMEKIIGLRARDFFPALLGDAYEANDRLVFESGRALKNEIWLVPTIRGTPGWFLSSKTPLRDTADSVIGLLGLMYPVETPEVEMACFGNLRQAIKHIETCYVDDISVATLAEIAGLSVPHFNRIFRKVLRLSPMQYVLSLRIQEAQKLLSTTRQPMSQIAAAVGFCDQSHFTKRFRKVTGLTPGQYQARFRASE